MTLAHHGLSQRSLGAVELMTLGVSASCPMAVVGGAVVADLRWDRRGRHRAQFPFPGCRTRLIRCRVPGNESGHPQCRFVLRLPLARVRPYRRSRRCRGQPAGVQHRPDLVVPRHRCHRLRCFRRPMVGLGLHCLVGRRSSRRSAHRREHTPPRSDPGTRARRTHTAQRDRAPRSCGRSPGRGASPADQPAHEWGVGWCPRLRHGFLHRSRVDRGLSGGGNRHRSVVIASYVTIGFLSIFYAVSSWAMVSAVGAENIVDTARDPSANLPFGILGERYGPLVGAISVALLITGIFAALLSFHNVVGRYVYSLAREEVLPAGLGRLGGAQGGVPIAASLVQTATAAVMIMAFALSGADPLATLFPWTAELSALGILTLMTCSSVAVVRYYRRQGRTLGLQAGRRARLRRTRDGRSSDHQHRQHRLDHQHRRGHGAPMDTSLHCAAQRRRWCRSCPANSQPEAQRVHRHRPRRAPSARGSGARSGQTGDVR